MGCVCKDVFSNGCVDACVRVCVGMSVSACVRTVDNDGDEKTVR